MMNLFSVFAHKKQPLTLNGLALLCFLFRIELVIYITHASSIIGSQCGKIIRRAPA